MMLETQTVPLNGGSGISNQRASMIANINVEDLDATLNNRLNPLLVEQEGD